MNKRQIIVSVITTLIVVFAGAMISNKLKANKKSTVSEGAIPEEIYFVNTKSFPPTSIKSSISIDGRLSAFEKINISSEATGRLQPISKTWRKGSNFKKGDLLFSVDDADSKFTLYAQRSSLLNAITQIMPDLKFDYPDAFEKWKTYLDNFDVEKNVRTLPKITSDQEKYFVAGKNIYNLYYSIKSAEDRLNNFQIVAPFSGVFLTVNAYPGSLVSPGSPLASLMNTSQYELESPISMSNFDFIKVGQKVNLTSDGIEKSFKGTISRVSRQIDQSTQSVPVFISVQGIGLRDGMYMKGSLEGNTISDVSAIPIEAVVNQNQVYYIKDSLIQEKSIDIVLRTNDEIIVKGLTGMEEIIIKGLNSLSPGQKATKIN